MAAETGTKWAVQTANLITVNPNRCTTMKAVLNGARKAAEKTNTETGIKI
jgi:hypothetical protein